MIPTFASDSKLTDAGILFVSFEDEGCVILMPELRRIRLTNSVTYFAAIPTTSVCQANPGEAHVVFQRRKGSSHRPSPNNV